LFNFCLFHHDLIKVNIEFVNSFSFFNWVQWSFASCRCGFSSLPTGREERQCPVGYDGQERSRDNAPRKPLQCDLQLVMDFFIINCIKC